MKIGLYTAALGTIVPEKRLEIIANNLANTETPGFKEDRAYFKNYIEEASYTVMKQGGFRSTGSPLDVAINGEGFFRVQKDGKTMYTRNGNFRLNADQELVTQNGWKVMGQGGPITLSNPIENSTDIRIEPDGQIFDGDDQIGTLDVVKFPPKARLKKGVYGYFQPEDPGVKPKASENYKVQQYYLEDANFEVPKEMASMVDCLREMESFQKAMRTYQEIESELIRKMGTP